MAVLTAPLHVLKVVSTSVPKVLTPLMITTEINAAIKAYSIAVTPSSLAVNDRIKFINSINFCCSQ